MKKLIFLVFLLITFSCDPPIRTADEDAMLVGNRAPLDTINIGTGPNTGTGEPLRTAFIKVNKTIRRVDSLKTEINDTVAFLTEDIRNVTIIHVGDTTVTAIVGRIVFKTSDAHFYGCKQTNTSYKKWLQLDN